MPNPYDATNYIVQVDQNGNESWHSHGQYHREENDKPARIYANGTKLYYKHGELHRENDKPAKDFHSGRSEWWQNDQLHRIGGPAIRDLKGSEEWYENGRRHRLDGPARTDQYGKKSWYIEGIQLSEDEFNLAINPAVELTVAKIEELLGHKIKIVKG